MPEIWVPYGQVESLITIQGENLGTVVEPVPEKSTAETERLTESIKAASALFVCDAMPATAELLKDLSQAILSATELKAYSAAPKRIESRVPELKGRFNTLPPPMSGPQGGGPAYAEQLTAKGKKLFIGTAKPDPLFGIVDAEVEASLNWVADSRRLAAQTRTEMEPLPFKKTEARSTIEGISGQIADASFLTVVPRGGKVRSVLEDAPFDAIKNSFVSAGMPQARAIVVGSGGSGYDDTLSGALRGVWNALPGVRRSGWVLLMAECSEGLGSTALEMLATGRIAGEGKGRKEKYLEGMEELFYLDRLKDEYEVFLLTGLPDVYAKSKLGLTTARGSGEGVGRLLEKLGRSGKMNVVTRAPECKVESA